MPGEETGRDFDNAFSWDFTKYPGGTRVTGETARYNGTGINRYDYWAVTLEKGKTYAIQTRIPSAFNTYLYLYNDQRSYIRADNDSGDDGYPLSKIVHTPSKEETFYVRVGGSYYYYDFGFYVLEIDPAPKNFRKMLWVPSRFSSRAPTAHAVPVAFDVISARYHTGVPSRFLVRGHSEAGNPDRFDARASGALAQTGARFTSVRTPTVVISPDRFDARNQAGAQTADRHDARRQLDAINPARFGTRSEGQAQVPVVFDAHGNNCISVPSRHTALTRPGWSLHARDTATGQVTDLGFIDTDAPAKELTDISLPDGIYEIEVRPHALLWPDTRSRPVITLTAGDQGGGNTGTGLPVIQNLHRTIEDGFSIIRWQVSEEANQADLAFGVWFDTAQPVDTNRPPDRLIAYYPQIGSYRTSYAHTNDAAVAVAAIVGMDRGEVSELALPWSLVPPISPPNQTNRHTT